MGNLQQILAQEDTVLFIGSGISNWSGLPSWNALIEELAQFVEASGADAKLIRKEAQRGDLLQAASYGFDVLTKQQIGEFIRSASRYGKAKPERIHQLIVSLGPRCYITTNYDDLIEQSLRKWQPDRFYRPSVTNRQLTETAEIVHARSIDFIFKPHGDAGDVESIILTREQYRQLLPQGEMQAALESTKLLLASRPVVYLGFGLRDPDFIYIKDLLANTYKSGARDHYAIMADVSDMEVSYWRKNYGIHLISYATIERSDKSRDHSALLDLLTALTRNAAQNSASAIKANSPEILLALARHAAALSRVPKAQTEFPIRVRNEVKRNRRSLIETIREFDFWTIDRFLDSGPTRAILSGLPGAGKTYALRQAAARFADKLHEACLADAINTGEMTIPVFIDLKLYRGDLLHLISQTLSSALPLALLSQNFKIRFFLDSFNEMPREYWESGSYEADFQQFFKGHSSASFIIGSRTADGLTKFDFPEYALDHIEESSVIDELSRRGIALEGRFSSEVRYLLQRPFYFQYVISGKITLPPEAHPKDFYRRFFFNVNTSFLARFGTEADLEQILASAAYNALDKGEEAFPISELLRALNDFAQSTTTSATALDIANWLVSTSVLVPYTGNRIAFIHQSITEYLAATDLAKKYLSDPRILREKLSLKRWDQALFITLSLLPGEKSEAFLNDVIAVDFALALNAAKYLETNRDNVISILLGEIPNNALERADSWQIASAIEYALPINEVHEPQLRAIIQCKNLLGAAAVKTLVLLKGESIKQEFLGYLFSDRSDFNFCCNGIGKALMPFASIEDAETIAAWSDEIDKDSDSEDSDSTGGFVSGAGEFLAEMPPSTLREVFLPKDKTGFASTTRAEILCEILREQRTTEALNLAAELLLLGVEEAATTIYFICHFEKEEEPLSYELLKSTHLELLVAGLNGEHWSLQALKCICEKKPELRDSVRLLATDKTITEKAVLLYCAENSLTPVFQALNDLLELTADARANLSFNVVSEVEFDWTGNEELFIELLKLRDAELAKALLGGSSPPTLPNLGTIQIGKIDWWLDWLRELGSSEESVWLVDQFGGLFGKHLGPEERQDFLNEFNGNSTTYQRLLMNYIIPHFDDVATDAFTETTISFLLADLNREQDLDGFRGHLLGRSATERFVTERLIPLSVDASGDLAENLRKILKHAGERHGRRYF